MNSGDRKVEKTDSPKLDSCERCIVCKKEKELIIGDKFASCCEDCVQEYTWDTKYCLACRCKPKEKGTLCPTCRCFVDRETVLRKELRDVREIINIRRMTSWEYEELQKMPTVSDPEARSRSDLATPDPSVEADVEVSKEYSDREVKVLELAFQYGRFGGEHKQWLLDQIVRTVLGEDENVYVMWVNHHNDQVQDDELTEKEVFEWSTGIAP